MAEAPRSTPAALRFAERVGRATLSGLASTGFGASLVGQSAYWLLLGPRRGQSVRPGPVFAEMMEVGIRAIPIVSMLTATIGVMLAIQGIYQLKRFGAEEQVVIGVAFGMTREFAPLITGILMAGRSGSAFAARLGTMTISQEVDALRVMGINPVRFLVAPSLLAMLVMLPALVIWADLVSLTAARILARRGAYTQGQLRSIYASGIRRVLQKNRPRRDQPYGTMQLIQWNWFLDRGLLRFADGGGPGG